MSKPLAADVETAAPLYKVRKQTLGAAIVIHLLLPLIALPWLFSWTGVVLVFLGNYIFCSIGIGLCYHRTLTHRGLKMPKWLEYFFAVLGVCSLQDSPCFWVAHHRAHHKHSDEDEDPHTPKDSFLWGHMGWVLVKKTDPRRGDMIQKYAPDIFRDPFYHWMEVHQKWVWVFGAHVLLMVGAGYLAGWLMTGTTIGAVQFGSSVFIWGVIARIAFTWHVTWAVNSVGHIWGYRNYKTSDNSRNNWWVALATNGEGWHNNHHADQRSAAHGHRWWELDVTYLTIRFLSLMGLARDIVKPARDSGHGTVAAGTAGHDANADADAGNDQ